MSRHWRSTRLPVLCAAFLLVLAACADEPDETTVDDEDEPDETTVDDEDEPDAEDVGDTGDRPLEGESITIVVGSSPGGGYDTYARMLAPHLEEQLEASNVVVENIPAAGGALAWNQVFAADGDGTTVSIINGPGAIGAVLGGADGVEFELDEFQWVGRIAGEPFILNVAEDSEYENIEQLVGYEDPFLFGSSGVGSGAHNTTMLMIEALEMQNADIIGGFDGTEEYLAAVTAGELDGAMPTLGSALGSIEAGDHVPIVVVADERIDELPDAPALAEVDLPGEEAEAVATSLIANTESGRLLGLPAATEQQYVDEYRRALQELVEDDEFIDQFEDEGRPIAWRDHEDVDAIIQDALDAPPVVGEILGEDL